MTIKNNSRYKRTALRLCKEFIQTMQRRGYERKEMLELLDEAEFLIPVGQSKADEL